MLLDQTPSSRKAYVPWYDTDLPCVVVIIGMGAVFIFSLIGIAVAREQAAFHDHLWMPILLALLSGPVFLSTAIRLIRRHAFRISR